MLYSFELVILGVLVLGAMCVCGTVLWWRRRKEVDGEPDGVGYGAYHTPKR